MCTHCESSRVHYRDKYGTWCKRCYDELIQSYAEMAEALEEHL